MSQAAMGRPPAGQFSVQDFWQLALQAQLYSPQQCQLLQQSFQQMKGAAHANAAALAEWLIAGQHLSRFQANVLLTGQPGPFVFGDYRVYDRVESGRLRGIFRAVHLTTQQPTCLQFLAGPLAQDPLRLAAVAQQAAVFNGVQHQNLSRCYHFADLQAYRFVSFENLHGQSVDEVLATQGPLPATEACRIARQVALALMCLEERRLTHGEIRPANVFINHLGTIKLLAFPLDRDPLAGVEPIDASTAANPHGRFARMADYLAPEIARGGQPGDIRADIYSLGCVLYQLLTGQVPYPEHDPLRKMLRHASEPLVPPDRINSAVPAAVSQLVQYLLAKDPGQRYQKASHVAEALVPYLDPQGLTAFADPPTAASQAYEGWLAQNYPAAQADPDTGEFDFRGRPDQFAHAQHQRAEAPPGFQAFAPVAPAQQFAPAPAFSPQPGFGAATPGGFPGINVGSAPAPAFGSSTTSQSVATHRPMSAAEKQRIEDERFAKKATQYTIVAVSSFAVIVLALIVVNALNQTPAEPPQVVEGTGAPQGTATPQGTAKAGTSVAPGGTAAPMGTEASSADDPLSGPKRTASLPKPNTVVKGPTPPRGVTGTPEPVSTGSFASEWEEMYSDTSELWPRPLTGPAEPLNYNYLPQGVQMVLSLRPAELLANPEGKKAWESLGGWGKQARADLEFMAGNKLENIELLHVGFLDNGENPAKVALVAYMTKSAPVEELVAKWGNPEAAPFKGRQMYMGSGRAWYMPSGTTTQVVACVPQEFKEDLVSDLPPAMRKELGVLMDMSDQRLQVNLLFAPNFLFSGGKVVFAGPAGILRDPLDEILKIDGVTFAPGGLLSAHVGDYFFTELRLHPGNFKPPAMVVKDTRDWLTQIPLKLFGYYHPEGKPVGFLPTDYSRGVLARFPKMLDVWAAYLTGGTDRKVAVLTSVLPTNAAHNLTLGTQLAIRDPGIDIGNSTQSSSGPKTLEEKLKQVKIPLVLGRDSLDRVLAQIADENGLTIKLNGNDLREEGITQNQSFGIDIKDPKPIEVVLQEIMFRANPDKTNPGIGDPKQKLLYVLSADKTEVIVTTRLRALERGIPPAAFNVVKK